jgi:hypothetical protein
MVVSPESNQGNLRSEYSVIGSYVTAMTGMRFQTMAIYIAALGFVVSRGAPKPSTLALILALSVGLWILDLRNREILRRLGDRGKEIEEAEWGYPKSSAAFFRSRKVRAKLQIATFEIDPKCEGLRLPRRFISHAFAIDLVFLTVIVYAILLLALPG